MKTEIQLAPNQVEQFNALKKACDEIVAACDKLQVTDEVTLAIATQNLSKANTYKKQIEDLRVKLKEPSIKEGKAIDALAKQFSVPLDNSINGGKSKILAYDVKVREEALQKQIRIQVITEGIQNYANRAIAFMDKCDTVEKLMDFREKHIVIFPGEEKWFEYNADALVMRGTLNDYAKARHIQLTNPTQADPETNVAIVEAITETIQNTATAELAEIVEPVKLAGTRNNWKMDCVNVDLVPRELMMPDVEKIKVWAKAEREAGRIVDGTIIHGFRFYIEQSLTIR